MDGKSYDLVVDDGIDALAAETRFDGRGPGGAPIPPPPPGPPAAAAAAAGGTIGSVEEALAILREHKKRSKKEKKHKKDSKKHKKDSKKRKKDKGGDWSSSSD
jgi:hypothetical protein